MRDVIVFIVWGVDGRTKEWNATISPYFDGRIKMNGPYPEITNISFLAKFFFLKTFISLKHLSDYRTVGLSDCWTIGLSDYSYGPLKNRLIFLCSFTKYYYFSLLQVNLQFPMMTILFKYSQRILHISFSFWKNNSIICIQQWEEFYKYIQIFWIYISNIF